MNRGYYVVVGVVLVILASGILVLEEGVTGWSTTSDLSPPTSHSIQLDFVGQKPDVNETGKVSVTVHASSNSSLNTTVRIYATKATEVEKTQNVQISGPKQFNIDLEPGEKVQKEINIKPVKDGSYHINAETDDLYPDEGADFRETDWIYFETSNNIVETDPLPLKEQN